MSELADRAPRERFVSELDRNFSVIASAGSGKTTAITQRVVQIAKGAKAREWLPKLVVVTYTNRAADELQQRAREQILKSVLSLDVAVAFNHAFFGTIHSFCLKLLASYGHYLGLPPELETIADDDNLWNEFVQRQTTIGRSLSEENRADLLRFVSVRQLMKLARHGNFDSQAIPIPPKDECPDTNFAEIYSVVVQGSAVRTVPRLQEELRRWGKRRRETKEFVPLPICTSRAKEFSNAWYEAFRPLREWINAHAMCVAAEVQRDYREFRLERGVINYYDQVALAIELMRHPEAGRQIREKGYRVILDEAQDTEPGQFSVLLEVARPPSANGLWIEQDNDPPRAGHFCMVGDFQQSIYRDRADLERYRQLHERLRDNGVAEELTFSVTFRLDRVQLNFVNQVFRDILNSLDGQVAFVKLNPRPDALPGQMIRFDLTADVEPTTPEEQRAASEARQLAEWLRSTGLEKLRADSWRQVAILSPRKAWLPVLRDALRAADLRAHIQSESDRKGESPCYAWLTALLTIMANPRAGYEIVGVLREIFGISDDALARFSYGDGTRFQIAKGTPGRGAVPDALNLLMRIHNAVVGQSLFAAVREIVRTTQLQERLLSLPADDFDDQAVELDALLAAAAQAEAKGITLVDFAEDLRANFDETREVRPSSEDAIQLMTAHKAKGLEWPVVIVPFLSRQVRTGSSRYPHAIKTVAEDMPQIVFHKTEIPPHLDSELKVSERQEMERLLYVALTRAKHSLVLPLDRELFAIANGEIHKDSQIKWLRCDRGGCNEQTFAAVSTEAQECAATAAEQRKSRTRIKSVKLTQPVALPPLSFENARKRAANFVHTLNPSGFSTEEERLAATGVDIWGETGGASKPPVLATPARRYGLWWHHFIQQIPWNADVGSWEQIFGANRPLSPDMARSSREWKILRDYFSGSADFRRQFTDRQFLAHPEMPFYWRMNENKCLEGVVDLALFDPAGRKWLILDWKTDRVPPEKMNILSGRYRSQIAAYWKAISEMTGMKVEAAIYSTPTAKLVIYGQDDLAREWARLKTLPLDQFTQAVSSDHAETAVQMEFAALSGRARRG